MTSHLGRTTLALLMLLPLASFGMNRVELVPKDAQTYVRLSNATNVLSQLKKSSIGKLWADRQFQDFIGNPDEESLRELIFKGQTDTEDEVFFEQLKMLKGEVIVAFDMESENPCIIAAMSEKDFLHSLDLDEKLAGAMDEPFKIIKSTFQDVEIVQHIEHVGTSRECSSWQAYLAGTLVMGNARAWVEKSIVQLKKEAIEEPEGNPVININLPMDQLIREKVLGTREHKPGTIDNKALFDALGLLGVEGFSTRIELKDTEMVLDNTLRVADIRKGIFTILDTSPSGLPSVGFIPEDITSLEVGRFNLLRFWQEIPTVLTTAIPNVKPQFDMLTAMIRQQTGIDLEQDLLANLGTGYISYTVSENDDLVSVMAIELKDSQAFKHGLETAMAAPALQPQVASMLDIMDFLGHTLYVTKTTESADAVGFAVMGNYLLYGQPDGIRQAIRNEASNSAINPAFEQTDLVKGLRQHAPQTAFCFSAIDWKKNMSFIVREITKPDRVRLIQQKWASSGSALPPPDFNKLPPVDHIASFFNLTYQYIEKTGSDLHQRIYLEY